MRQSCDILTSITLVAVYRILSWHHDDVQYYLRSSFYVLLFFFTLGPWKDSRLIPDPNLGLCEIQFSLTLSPSLSTFFLHSCTVKGLAISSEPSIGLTMVIRGPRTTTSPNDRVCGSGSVACVCMCVCVYVNMCVCMFCWTLKKERFTVNIFFDVVEDEV